MQYKPQMEVTLFERMSQVEMDMECFAVTDFMVNPT